MQGLYELIGLFKDLETEDINPEYWRDYIGAAMHGIVPLARIYGATGEDGEPNPMASNPQDSTLEAAAQAVVAALKIYAPVAEDEDGWAEHVAIRTIFWRAAGLWTEHMDAVLGDELDEQQRLMTYSRWLHAIKGGAFG